MVELRRRKPKGKVIMSTALNLPGPRGHLIRGNLPEYVRDPLNYLMTLAREYGDMVRLRFFGFPVYIFNNPDHIEQVLVTNNRHFIKPVDFRMPLFRGIFGNGLLTSEGDFWLRQRRVAQTGFFPTLIDPSGKIMGDCTNQKYAGREEREN